MRFVVVADVSGPRNWHLGDEAMLEANLRTLRRIVPDVEFTVLSGDPGWTGRFFETESLHSPDIPQGHSGHSWTRRMLETAISPNLWAEWLGDEITTALRGSAGLLISGGGNMCATWPERLLERVGLIELARGSGLPAVMSGQTLGPALTFDQHGLLSRSLAKLNWLGTRDEGSAALARSLGVPAACIHRQLDDAFFLAPLPVTDARADVFREDRRRWIAITLDASFGAPGRAQSLAVLARQFDALADSLQASLVFVPHVGGDDAGDVASDATAARALTAQMRSSLLQLDHWQPREVRWLTERVMMVVSTRYHPLVFATAAGIPACGIWSDDYTRAKIRGALAPARLEGWSVPVAEVDRGAFLPLALELWHRRDSVWDRLAHLRAEAKVWEAGRWDGICRALGLKPQSEANAELPDPPAAWTAPRRRSLSSQPAILTEEQWNRYDRDGYLRLGRLLDERELAVLRERLDTMPIEAGTCTSEEQLHNPAVRLPGPILGVESDPLVLGFLRHEIFREVCARQYGAHASISLFRTMLIGGHSGPGADLSWHQNGDAGWKLDRDPLLTLWVALDPVACSSGCFQVIPGTHRLGLLDRNDSASAAGDAEHRVPAGAAESLELKAGEGLLLHNWLLQRIDINPGGVLARVLGLCYVDARTLDTRSGQRFPLIFGAHANVDSATPFLSEIIEENRRLGETVREATRYVDSLLEDKQQREHMRCEAEAYAKSLEVELAKIRTSTGSRTASRANVRGTR